MIVERLAIPDVLLLTPPRFLRPARLLLRDLERQRFADAGIPGPFVQDNHARSTDRGVLRGLHCQIGPQRAGQAGAGGARRDLGRGGGHPARLADLRQACRRRC